MALVKVLDFSGFVVKVLHFLATINATKIGCGYFVEGIPCVELFSKYNLVTASCNEEGARWA